MLNGFVRKSSDSGVQRREHIFAAIQRRQHDQIHVAVDMPPDRPAHAQAVGTRHHPVENREPRPCRPQQRFFGIHAVVDGLDLVSEALERQLKEPQREWVVVCDQNLHAYLTARRLGPLCGTSNVVPGDTRRQS